MLAVEAEKQTLEQLLASLLAAGFCFCSCSSSPSWTDFDTLLPHAPLPLARDHRPLLSFAYHAWSVLSGRCLDRLRTPTRTRRRCC